MPNVLIIIIEMSGHNVINKKSHGSSHKIPEKTSGRFL